MSPMRCVRPIPYLMLVTLLACGGEETKQRPPAVIGSDAGTGTEVGIAVRPDGAGQLGRDTAVVDAPAADLLGPTGDAKSASPPPTVTVSILKPLDTPTADSGIAAPIFPKSEKLAPEVRVQVESHAEGNTDDLLEKVTASLVSVKGNVVATSANLIQIQFDRVTSSNTATYLFANQNLDIASVGSGLYQLEIVAKTVGGTLGKAAMQIFVDAGPTIQFVQPVADSSWKGSMIASVLISDPFSSIQSVAFTIGQTTIDPKAVVSSGDRYSATIDFNAFQPPLDGAQIIAVAALNGNGNQSVSSRRFIIDNQGPTISGTTPAVGGLIGRVVTLQATVTDSAGVMESSVVAVVAHGDSRFQVVMDKVKDNLYQKQFDTTKLPNHAIFPTISFRAQDVLGNQSSIGYDLSLDNTPPIIALDPPDRFRLYKKSDTGYLCSHPFDPVGPDAVDDGAVVNQLFDIRARIEDEGNDPLTGTADFIPIAGVDAKSVGVLILDDTTHPLVVDSSNPPDGICDEINPELVPSTRPQNSKEAQYIGMVSLPAHQGSGDFSFQPGVACTGKEKAPELICDTAYSAVKSKGMTYILGYSANLPSIWTIPPIISDRLQCVGRQFDASNSLHDGWVCIAAVAADGLGNKQVSPPIRVCVQATQDSTACSLTALGAVDLSSLSFSASIDGEITFMTKSPLLGPGGTALKKGDLVTFANVYPKGLMNGTQEVEPIDASGMKFRILNKHLVPPQLIAFDGTAGASRSHGSVGVVVVPGQPVQVVTNSLSRLDPAYTGKVRLQNVADQPEIEVLGDLTVSAITADGFTLPEVLGAPAPLLSGHALSEAILPNCTGTAISQGSNLPPVVDGKKPCKPWAQFPQEEALYLR